MTGAQRRRLFEDAVRALPAIPLQIILLPLEGDPLAASLLAPRHAARGQLHEPGGGLAPMARPRRDVADSGLAFLDVVSCGFGAVILLLIITKSVAPEDTSASAEGLAGDAATLQAAVLSAQGRRDELREATAAAKARIEALKQRLAAQQATEAALEAQARRAADALADAKDEGRADADARQSSQKLSSAFFGAELPGPQ